MRATVVGGGIAGLMASIAPTEARGRVHLLEAHRRLGGRARSSSGPFVTNFGPHALYGDGPWRASLAERQLLTPVARPRLTPRTFEQACACGQSDVAAVASTTDQFRCWPRSTCCRPRPALISSMSMSCAHDRR